MLISIVKKTQIYFIASFLVMIGCGTLLLKLPWLYRGTASLSWIDALFTATSSVCITGLSTVPLTEFTPAGQLLILLMIQLGGIGIMTLTASIMLLMGHQLSFGDTLMIANLSERFSLRGTETLTRSVLNYTILTEVCGMLLLLPGFLLAGFPWPESLWYAFFHAVSAFCNAGVSPLPHSMVGLSIWIKLVVALLIILGGLGVYVVYDLQSAWRQKQKLHAQTRLILITTAALLLIGTGTLWLLQRTDQMPIAWVDAFFQAATARTAGFNSIPMDRLTSGSIAVLIILMQIGGAPGSTAGGIKVTTVALAVAAIYNTFKGNERVLLFRREIPGSNVLRAFALIVTYVFLAGFGGIILQSLTDSSMQWAFFESVSALGTVGLALNNPEPLTAAAKGFIIVYMFLGRVGLFTIFLFLLGREHKSRLTYPEERIIVS